MPNPSDLSRDDALLAELREAFATLDPIPPGITEKAQLIFRLAADLTREEEAAVLRQLGPHAIDNLIVSAHGDLTEHLAHIVLRHPGLIWPQTLARAGLIPADRGEI